MLRFRLFGIPFEITLYFWIGSAILGSNIAQQDRENGMFLLLTWVVCVLVSIMAHELGHALAGRYYGLQPRVVLLPFGGLTYLPGGGLTRPQHIVVSLAGPAAGGLMFLAAHSARYLLGTSGLGDFLYAPTRSALIGQEAFRYLFRINGLWTLLNLLPILPLDGGQVLRDILGPGRIRTSRLIGAVCAVGCCVLAIQHGMMITAFFVGYLAYANFTGGTQGLPGGVRGN